MKFLRVLCVVALVAFFAVSAYAETQNVKVSGDLAMRGFARDNYGLNTAAFPVGGRTDETTYTALGVYIPGKSDISRPNQGWFMSTTEVQIDADLTDNVSTCIRLVNQRDWNVTTTAVTNYGDANQVSTFGSGGFGHGADYLQGAGNSYDEFGVDLELAYVTLKNFLYSPLTVTIGRQNLWFGKGFVVGANQRVSLNQPISAPEYTALNAFDSVKAVLDFDPWTLTSVYAKIWQNDIQADDGLDLYGVNVGYKFDAYKAEAEAYWFYKRDLQVRAFKQEKNGSNDVNTIGMRGSFDPIDVITVYAEAAMQTGNYLGTQVQDVDRSRLAGAIDVGAEFRYFMDKWAWKPKGGVEFIWYSGDRAGIENTGLNGASGQFNGWDPMFRGKSDSLIREYIGRYYFSQKYGFNIHDYYNTVDASFQNQGQVIFMGSLQPMDSLKLTGNLNLFWNQYSYNPDTMKDLGYIGTELDMGATWDYTEDVSFNLAAGFFVPGDVYQQSTVTGRGSPTTASDVVASVKVSF